MEVREANGIEWIHINKYNTRHKYTGQNLAANVPKRKEKKNSSCKADQLHRLSIKTLIWRRAREKERARERERDSMFWLCCGDHVCHLVFRVRDGLMAMWAKGMYWWGDILLHHSCFSPQICGHHKEGIHQYI